MFNLNISRKRKNQPEQMTLVGSASTDKKKKIKASNHKRSKDKSNTSSKKVLLAGASVFASLNASEKPENYVQQTPREANGYIKSLFNGKGKKIHVAIEERLFGSKTRYALAIDGYLAWGLKQKNSPNLVFIGGAHTEHSTEIHIIVFQNGEVISITDKSLPAKDDLTYIDALEGLISGLNNTYSAARIVHAAPLDNFGMDGVEYIGDEPLKGLSFKPLVSATSKAQWLLPSSILALGLAIYSGLLLTGWQSYTQEMSKYQRAIEDVSIKEQGGIDNNFLEIMNARRFFMEQPRRQVELAKESIRLVRGIGVVPDVQIVEIKLPAPVLDNRNNSTATLVDPENIRKIKHIMPDRTPDVWMSITVPKNSNTAIEHAKNLMTSIANSTGMSLRLAHQGWSDIEDRRKFNIEGFIHDTE